MEILYFLVPVAVLLGFGFLLSFYWAVQDGQMDDLETPAHRILSEEMSDDNSKEKAS
jgi:cbb3-type cytochrome oxidase maturation protein